MGTDVENRKPCGRRVDALVGRLRYLCLNDAQFFYVVMFSLCALVVVREHVWGGVIIGLSMYLIAVCGNIFLTGPK